MASPTTEWGRGDLGEPRSLSEGTPADWDMSGAPDTETSLVVGRRQVAARADEAGRVAAFSVHTRSSITEWSGNGPFEHALSSGIPTGAPPVREESVPLRGIG